MAIIHSVWKTPAPPVGTSLWNQADWDKFEAGFRPEGYLGCRYNKDAWEVFLADERDRAYQSLLPKSYREKGLHGKGHLSA